MFFCAKKALSESGPPQKSDNGPPRTTSDDEKNKTIRSAPEPCRRFRPKIRAAQKKSRVPLSFACCNFPTPQDHQITFFGQINPQNRFGGFRSRKQQISSGVGTSIPLLIWVFVRQRACLCLVFFFGARLACESQKKPFVNGAFFPPPEPEVPHFRSRFWFCFPGPFFQACPPPPPPSRRTATTVCPAG